jgi:hypothetical protein
MTNKKESSKHSSLNSKTPHRVLSLKRGKPLILCIVLALGLAGGSVALALQISLDSPATLPSDI